MSDTKTTLTWLLKDEVSGKAAKVKSSLGDLEGKAKSSGGLMGKLGAATGGLVTPFSLALGGVTLLTGALAGSIKAAIDEQKGIEKMGAALKANVPNWNGNTDAIEDLISKREDLAFSDDDLRASMSILVTSTKDVTEAQNLQAIAMDLARFKGVDLATASEAVAKASQGSTREIKALGLELDDSATATENLLAIQKATAGQAEGYAKTMSGKWETFNNKLGDVVEQIGGFLLPIIEGMMDFLLTTVIPAFGELAKILGPILTPIVQAVGTAFDIMGKAISWVIDNVVKPAIQTVGKIIDFIKSALRFLGILNDSPVRTPDSFATSHYAEGGTTASGWAWVGERGPELVKFSGGQQVYSASQSAQMAGGGGGSPVVIALHLDGREVSRVVDEHLYYALAAAPPRAGAF